MFHLGGAGKPNFYRVTQKEKRAYYGVWYGKIQCVLQAIVPLPLCCTYTYR